MVGWDLCDNSGGLIEVLGWVWNLVLYLLEFKPMIRGKNTRYKNSTNRRRGDGVVATAQITVNAFADGSATTTVDFDQAVFLSGIPAWTDVSTPTITVNSATQTGTDQITMIWNAAPTVAVAIPFQDPAIRNAAGGYVRDSTFTF